MTGKVFLLVLLVFPSGQIVSGNDVDGWHEREQPGIQECLERARFMRQSMPPAGIERVIAYCEVENE